MKITYKEIANYINRTEWTIKNYKKVSYTKWYILKIGSICKKYNLDLETIKQLLELRDLLKAYNIKDTKALKKVLKTASVK